MHNILVGATCIYTCTSDTW